MITITNYLEKKDSIDWNKMPKTIVSSRSDIEDMMEFYNDDADIKDAIDLFLKGINDNLKPTIKEIADNSNGKIIIAKVDGVEKNQLLSFEKGDKIKLTKDKKLRTDGSSGSDYRIANINDYVYRGVEEWNAELKGYHKILSSSTTFYIPENIFVDYIEDGTIVPFKPTSVKKAPSSKTNWVIYSDGKFATKKTTQSDYSFTDNDNFAYTWPDSEQEIATKIARKLNAIAMPLDQALEMQEVFISNKKSADKRQTIPFTDSKFKNNFDVYTGRYYSDVDLFSYDATQVHMDEVKSESEFETLKRKRVLIYRPKTLSSMQEQGSEVRNVMLYAKFKDQKAFKAIGDGRQVENLLYATIFPIENIDKLKASISPGDDVHFQIRVAGGAKVLWDSKKDSIKPTTKTTKAKKTKVEKVIVQKKIITITPEYLLIKRFWNIIKNEEIVIPFRTTQLLNMAFNKAAVERKVRKTSEAADLFTECQKKINVLFQEFAAPTQSDVKVNFTDKKLYAKIQEYVTTSTVNPAVPVLNRFIKMQNTLPDVKKAETLLKSIIKVIENDKNNRLAQELNQAKFALEKYIAKPKETIEPKVYGLSVPAVCTNRVKCAGIDKNGKLLKGYKFEEHTGHVIRIRKTKSRLASPNVCENRVKCTGLSKSGKLLKGYKFEEGTNHVVKVRKSTVKKKVVKKKVAAGLGYSDNLHFEGVERIYVDKPIMPISFNANAPISKQTQDFTNNTQNELKKEPISKSSNVKPVTIKPKNKLMEMQFDSLDMDEGWERFMQHPAKNMKVAIWGKPKNGKTAGSLQMADYLSKFGMVLYNFADQGFNKSTQDLWKMSGLADNTNAEPSDVSTLADLEKEVATGKYSFVFIDMISDYINKENIKPYEFKERFMKKYPNVSFILIFEVTKGGDFKGDQGWTHIVDAIVTVEDFLMENRGRYGVGSHIVWEDGFKKFNPKKYAEVKEELQPEPEIEFSEQVESI